MSDPVLAADADVDGVLLVRSSPKHLDGDHTGEDIVLAAQGGRPGAYPGDGESEETPLLARSSSNGGGGSPPGHADFAGLPWHKRPSIYWMLPMFFLTAIANAGIIVPKMNLLISLICREYFADESLRNPTFTSLPINFNGDNPQCRSSEVSSRVAQFTLYGNLISGILCAITSPKLGALSDRYGRLRIVVFTSTGMLLGEVILLCAATYPDTFPVNWILVGFAIEGMFGSYIAAMAIANSYATDCIPVDRRSVVFGYFHAALFTGIALGPIVSAYIIKALGSVLAVFYIAIAVHVGFILFTGLVVPESLTKARQTAAREKHAMEQAALGPAGDWINQIRSFNLLEPLKILYPTGPGSSPAVRRNLLLLAGIDTTSFGVHIGSMMVVIIYTNYQFGWANFETSRLVSIVNGSRVFCLLVVLPIITRVFRGPRSRRQSDPALKPTGADHFDLAIIRTALFFDTLGYLGYTVAKDGTLFLVSGAVAAAGGIGSPTLQSSLTKHVPADRTGQLLGAMGLLHALARVIAPTVFNAIYAATVGKFTQLVFVCLTVLFGAACAAAFFIKAGLRLDEGGELEVEVDEENRGDWESATVCGEVRSRE